MRHFKHFAQNQTRLICNKDYMALKTSTKMVVIFAQVTFGEFSSFVWTREQIWYGKVTLVKIHWQILFNKFLCSVWTQILCYNFCDKYSLPNKHCSWELSFIQTKMVPISLLRRGLSPLYKDVIWSLWTCRTWLSLNMYQKNVARTWLNHDVGDNFNIHIWACYSNFIVKNRLVQ